MNSRVWLISSCLVLLATNSFAGVVPTQICFENMSGHQYRLDGYCQDTKLWGNHNPCREIQKIQTISPGQHKCIKVDAKFRFGGDLPHFDVRVMWRDDAKPKMWAEGYNKLNIYLGETDPSKRKVHRLYYYNVESASSDEGRRGILQRQFGYDPDLPDDEQGSCPEPYAQGLYLYSCSLLRIWE